MDLDSCDQARADAYGLTEDGRHTQDPPRTGGGEMSMWEDAVTMFSDESRRHANRGDYEYEMDEDAEYDEYYKNYTQEDAEFDE